MSFTLKLNSDGIIRTHFEEIVSHIYQAPIIGKFTVE